MQSACMMKPLLKLFAEDKVNLLSTRCVFCKCIFSWDLNTFCLFSCESILSLAVSAVDSQLYQVYRTLNSRGASSLLIFTQPVFANRAKLTTHDKITAHRCTATQWSQMPQRDTNKHSAFEDDSLSSHKQVVTHVESVSAGRLEHSTVQTSIRLIRFKIKEPLSWNLEPLRGGAWS